MSSKFDKYFYDVVIDCPYGVEQKAVYRQAQFGVLPDDIFEFFLESGYRRNGNYIYSMACENCQDCIPIRLDASTFDMNRNQKRVFRKNNDLIVKIEPLTITNEKLAICDKFLQERFPGKGNSAIEYYAGFFVNSLDVTYEVEYWSENRLVGVSIVDFFPNALNCVYFYFDPDEAERSPGTYNILYLTEFARKNFIKYVYLGYLINDVKSMSYKVNFKPHYLLIDRKWKKYAR